MTLESDRTDGVFSFAGQYEKLSNFYPVIIQWKKRTFPTLEHAFVSEKSHDPVFKNRIVNLRAEQAGYAKRLGRKVELREDWDDVKDSIMEELINIKFSYEEFKKILIITGNRLLVEGNWWHDNYWGNCTCNKCRNIVGLNKLGKILMKKREDIWEKSLLQEISTTTLEF